MTTFTPAELAYLAGEHRLARIATADAAGLPHVTPVGMWGVDAERHVITVSGRNFDSTKKYRNLLENPQAALVVDDVQSRDPWRPRAVMIQGSTQIERTDSGVSVVLAPTKIVSWGL